MNLSNIQEIENKISRFKDIDINQININEVSNIDDICIDESVESEVRIYNFLNEIINPYFFNIDGFLVKFSFSDDGKNAEECINDTIKFLLNK